VLSDKTLVTGATYLKAVDCLGTETAGTVKFYDGTSASGKLILEIDVPENSKNIQEVKIPTPGLLCNTGLHVTFPTGCNIVAFYGV
jgi:hypothetical protein